MSDQINLVFKGQIESGWQQAEVAANLAKLLKISDDKALALFSKETVIKRNVSFPDVKKYVTVFKRAGATLDVVAAEAPEDNARPAEQEKVPQATPEPVADHQSEEQTTDSSLTLCPEGTPVLEENERADEVVYQGEVPNVDLADVGANIGDPKEEVAPLEFDFDGIEVEEIEDVPAPTLEPKG